MAETAEPRLSTRRALALLGGMLLASWLVWLSFRADPSELARAEVGPGPGGSAGQAQWTGGAPPLSATAGPQRFLGGDWSLPGAEGGPSPLRPLEGGPAAGGGDRGRGEAHLVPQAGRIGEQLRALRRLPEPEPFKRSFAGAGNGSPVGSAQAASTQTARVEPAAPPPAADPPPPAPEPPAPKRRLFIPIPDPKGGGIREARERPTYRTSETPSTTTQGGPGPSAIDIDKELARPAGSEGYQQALSSAAAYDLWRAPSGKRELQRIGVDTFRVPSDLRPEPKPKERPTPETKR